MEARTGQALREMLEQLRQEVADLTASRERLVLAADADRRELERRLHDGVQQHLVALTVDLQLAGRLLHSDPVAARALLEEIERHANEARDDATRLAERVYPPLLGGRGLGAALRSVAAGARASARVALPESADYPPEIAAAFYFCVLELLERARDGSKVDVTVREEDGALVFEAVEDDRGSANRDSSRVAEDRLRDRVEALGGRLRIASEPGLGTRISGSLPTS